MSGADTSIVDVDPFSAIPNLTESVKQKVEKEIIGGIDPYEALQGYGIKKSQHNQMLQASEPYRNWVAGCLAQRNKGFKTKIQKIIDKIDDPDKKAKALMDFYSKLDKEFGTKHVEAKTLNLDATVNPVNYDDLIKKNEEDAAKP